VSFVVAGGDPIGCREYEIFFDRTFPKRKLTLQSTTTVEITGWVVPEVREATTC
jgi:hypothetical protein